MRRTSRAFDRLDGIRSYGQAALQVAAGQWMHGHRWKVACSTAVFAGYSEPRAPSSIHVRNCTDVRTSASPKLAALKPRRTAVRFVTLSEFRLQKAAFTSRIANLRRHRN